MMLLIHVCISIFTHLIIMKRSIFSVLLFMLIFGAMAKERIQIGKMYKGGDYVHTPLTGIYMTVPEYWRGYATAETEMMTLSSDTSMPV